MTIGIVQQSGLSDATLFPESCGNFTCPHWVIIPVPIGVVIQKSLERSIIGDSRQTRDAMQSLQRHKTSQDVLDANAEGEADHLRITWKAVVKLFLERVGWHVNAYWSYIRNFRRFGVKRVGNNPINRLFDTVMLRKEPAVDGVNIHAGTVQSTVDVDFVQETTLTVSDGGKADLVTLEHELGASLEFRADEADDLKALNVGARSEVFHGDLRINERNVEPTEPTLQGPRLA